MPPLAPLGSATALSTNDAVKQNNPNKSDNELSRGKSSVFVSVDHVNWFIKTSNNTIRQEPA